MYARSGAGEFYTNPSNAVQDIIVSDVDGIIRGVLPLLKWQIGLPKTGYVKQLNNSFSLSGIGFNTAYYVSSRTALSLEEN